MKDKLSCYVFLNSNKNTSLEMYKNYAFPHSVHSVLKQPVNSKKIMKAPLKLFLTPLQKDMPLI